MARPALPAAMRPHALPPLQEGARFTFCKAERLSRRSHLDALFAGGPSFVVHPFRVVWQWAAHPEAVPAQVVISVGKKRFTKAVHRNRIKRLIREAFRHHKPRFFAALPQGQTLHFMLSFVSDEMPEAGPVFAKLEKALARLAAEATASLQPPAEEAKSEN